MSLASGLTANSGASSDPAKASAVTNKPRQQSPAYPGGPAASMEDFKQAEGGSSRLTAENLAVLGG